MDMARQVIVFDAAEGHQGYADPAGHPFCTGWGQPSREAFAARRLGPGEPGQSPQG